MRNIVFYHAGCPVCVTAENKIANLVKAEIVHLGETPERIKEAEKAGVKSVPALVIDGEVLHINFGASIEDLKS